MEQTTSSPPLQTVRTALATTQRCIRSQVASGRLQGRTLVLARSMWLAVAALTVALYVAAVWVQISRVRGRCPPGLCVHGQVPPAVARSFADLHLSVSFYGWYIVWLNVVFAAGFAAVAGLLFWRRSHDPLALFVSLALLLFGLCSFESGFLAGGLPSINPSWRLPIALLGFAGEMTFGIFVCVFPDGRFVPRWTRLAALVMLTLWWLPVYFFNGSPLDFTTWPGVAFFAGWGVLLGVMAGSQIYRYRHVSTPAERLQTKWVVFGFVIAGIGYIAGQFVLYFLAPPRQTSPGAVLADLAGFTLAYAGILLIPICIGVAVLRYHLFDIDVIIRRTLIYSILTGMLATVYAIIGIVLQAAFEAVTQQASALAIVGSTLVIAALFQPVRSRVQVVVDQRFYRRKYDAALTLQTFGQTLHGELDVAQLSEKLVAVVQQTMQPNTASLWLVRPASQGGASDKQRLSHAAEAEAASIPTLATSPSAASDR